jgi:hypothetical protein
MANRYPLIVDSSSTSIKELPSGDALLFLDNEKIKVGTGSDLTLYHDATNSYITNAVGALKIATETSGIAVTIGHTTSETTIADNLVVAGDIDLAGSIDVDGTMEADAITLGGVTLAETIADTVGAMVGSNTETGIAVTYEDGDNTLDFVIGTLNQNTTGSAATLTTARAIGGVNFDGSAAINLPGVNTAGNQATSGLAATATALATARTIGGTSFDGTANIVPATVTVADTTDTSSYVALFESATGDLGPKTDAGVTYNAGTGALTATSFVGPLTGNVTGNSTRWYYSYRCRSCNRCNKYYINGICRSTDRKCIYSNSRDNGHRYRQYSKHKLPCSFSQ